MLLAAIYDRMMKETERAGLGDWRRALLASAEGDVLEIGAGTGANLPYYGDTTERLVLAEPSPFMRRKLRDKLDASGGEAVELVGGAAEELPFADGTFDTVVSTLVLCSVNDQERALQELRRVLRPGGLLLFIEHVAAEESSGRYRWQRRVEPVWKRFAGNCHLTRVTDRAIAEAGFEIEDITRASMRKAMPIVRPTIRGVARAK